MKIERRGKQGKKGRQKWLKALNEFSTCLENDLHTYQNAKSV